MLDSVCFLLKKIFWRKPYCRNLSLCTRQTEKYFVDNETRIFINHATFCPRRKLFVKSKACVKYRLVHNRCSSCCFHPENVRNKKRKKKCEKTSKCLKLNAIYLVFSSDSNVPNTWRTYVEHMTHTFGMRNRTSIRFAFNSSVRRTRVHYFHFFFFLFFIQFWGLLHSTVTLSLQFLGSINCFSRSVRYTQCIRCIAACWVG